MTLAGRLIARLHHVTNEGIQDEDHPAVSYSEAKT